jgi:prepilin-type processing-associated H-X9-DG protein
MIRSDTATNFGQISGFKSLHPIGANMLMGDGAVRFVNETIDYVAFNMLGSRANNDTATSEL